MLIFSKLLDLKDIRLSYLIVTPLLATNIICIKLLLRLEILTCHGGIPLRHIHLNDHLHYRCNCMHYALCKLISLLIWGPRGPATNSRKLRGLDYQYLDSFKCFTVRFAVLYSSERNPKCTPILWSWNSTPLGST